MENIKGIIYAVWRGILDSLRGAYFLFRVDSSINERLRQKGGKGAAGESRVLARTAQCCALNGGVFLTSIAVFYWALMPALKVLLEACGAGNAWGPTSQVLALVFEAVWVLPLLALSKVVNALWFQDIADWSWRYSQGGRPRAPPSLSRALADTLASLLVQALFLIQANLSYCLPVPIISDSLAILHTSLLYALYSFEYSWCNKGWELHVRLSYVERHWPYFLGFGLPLAGLSHLTHSSWVVSGCLFSLLFPLLIISAGQANPVVTYCAAPLRLFSPSVSVSNLLFTKTVAVKPS